MDLVVYGSFNCPYSYLASLRVDRLQVAGATRIEWRAVVHDPDVPAEGTPVTGEFADKLDKEIEEIRGLLAPGEPYLARRPAIEPNTTAAVARFCAVGGDRSDSLRAAIFQAYWVAGEDIGDREVLDRLGCPAESPGERMNAWQSQWSNTERKIVPMMVLPDGKVSRGLGALARLSDMEAAAISAR